MRYISHFSSFDSGRVGITRTPSSAGCRRRHARGRAVLRSAYDFKEGESKQ